MSATVQRVSELAADVIAAWRVENSSAAGASRERIARTAQDRLRQEWPSLGAALEQLEQLEEPRWLMTGTVADAETRRELIEALERMYTRARASGMDESAAVRSILERAL